jgi:hypothetical protein
MKRMAKISIAVACALGMSAVVAQSVQRGGVTVSNSGGATQPVAQAAITAPIHTAQAGGTSGGASTSGTTAATGMSTGTIVAVTTAAVAIAISASNSSTSH